MFAKRRRHVFIRGGAALAAGVLAAGCASSSGPSGSGSHAVLTLDVLQPFSGSTAFEGPEQLAGCLAGMKVVNAAGGVLGHKLQCTPTDDKGDPADAVPVTDKMLASTSNLAGVIGPAQTAPAVEPLIAAAHIPMFSDCGCAQFDHNTNPYYFRIDPSDSLAGIAMAYWASSQHGNHAAASFTNDPGAQTTVPSLVTEYKKLGHTFAVNQTLVPDQSSYQTEVQSLLVSHPSVIVTEMDPQTAGTYFSEVQQLDHGQFPKVEVTNLGLKGSYIQAVTSAIGKSLFSSNFVSIAPISPTGPGFPYYKKQLLTLGSAIKDPAQYLSDSYSIADYDSVILAALAMSEAKSTTPSAWIHLVLPIANGQPGAVLVHSYTAGLAAIKQGKKVHYIGANGPFAFNKYQNAAGAFEVLRWVASGQPEKEVGLMSLAVMQKITSR
jgi:ABC-type branched-subunit amino acid transport system substrate-binding protein